MTMLGWEMLFERFDEDGSGGLDLGELTNLYAKMRLPELSKRKLAALFADLEKTEVGDNGSVVRLGYVTFEAFAVYFNGTQERERRLAIRRVKEVFKTVHLDPSSSSIFVEDSTPIFLTIFTRFSRPISEQFGGPGVLCRSTKMARGGSKRKSTRC